MSSDGKPCQYCGQMCGNAGALTQHERACPHNPDNAPGGGPQRDRRPAPAGGRQADPRPARRGGGGGAGVADTLFVLTNFDEMPSDMRREAVQQGAGFLGGAINRWLDLREASMERSRERAESAELSPVEEFPTCNDCDYQFGPEDLNGDQVRCPDCSRLYNVELRDTAEQPA